MIETLLVIIFIYIFVAHYGKNWFSPPIIEGNTNVGVQIIKRK